MQYTNCHAQFVFILLYINIQMYFRIYKALNVLLWTIPYRKKYLRDGGQHAFQHAFCQHVRVVERLFLLDFDKHSLLFIQLLHTYMLYILFKLI